MKLKLIRDTNGNKRLSVAVPGFKAFSVQTNGNLPLTHAMDNDSIDFEIASAELVGYIEYYGTPRQQTALGLKAQGAKRPNMVKIRQANPLFFDRSAQKLFKTKKYSIRVADNGTNYELWTLNVRMDLNTTEENWAVYSINPDTLELTFKRHL